MRWAAAATCAIGLAAAGWLWSLPRLDPTGQEDSSAAVRAMIEGRPVRNVASGWPITQTGWPFFERYTPRDEKEAMR